MVISILGPCPTFWCATPFGITVISPSLIVNAGWINFRLGRMSLGQGGLDAKSAVGAMLDTHRHVVAALRAAFVAMAESDPDHYLVLDARAAGIESPSVGEFHALAARARMNSARPESSVFRSSACSASLWAPS